jgi:hypothetical protein
MIRQFNDFITPTTCLGHFITWKCVHTRKATAASCSFAKDREWDFSTLNPELAHTVKKRWQKYLYIELVTDRSTILDIKYIYLPYAN